MNLRRYIGIPFVNRASGFSGADCFGLVRLFYREEFAYLVPDPLVAAGSTKVFAKYLLEIQSNWETIAEPENYCVVAIAHDIEIPNVVQHFGLYIDGNLLHTLEKVGSNIEPFDRYKWCVKGFHKWRNS